MAGDEGEKAEEEKDTELDQIAEQELLRLMRQFRVSFHNNEHQSVILIFSSWISKLLIIYCNISDIKVLEGDKEAYLEEATKALRRQRKVIFDLENQKLQLARSLGVCRSKENTRKDSTNANFIANLAEEQVNIAMN